MPSFTKNLNVSLSQSSIFENASGTTIENGSVISVAGDMYTINEATRRIEEMEIALLEQVKKGQGYWLHKADFKGKLVLVKVFNGLSEQQHFKTNVNAFRKYRYMHSNVARIIYYSSANVGQNPFLIYPWLGPAWPCKLEYLAVHMLQSSLTESVRLSIKTVKGFAAAIDYLREVKFPLDQAYLNKNKCFDIMLGYDNNPLLVIHAEDLSFENDHDEQCTSKKNQVLADWLVFNALCKDVRNFCIYTKVWYLTIVLDI
ncbi:hypothetical protein BDQ17DRAFT_577689 [Cyathus striatus]|nr:hypothetical protein BDQ17DRAFT_577689 [Cyathus striatus]